MLTATVTVTYESDWTSDLGSLDVSGIFLASTFVDERYLGLFALETSELDEVTATIEQHSSVQSVDVVERFNSHAGRESATLLIREIRKNEPTPAQLLHREGYLPFGPTRLRQGTEYFDLLLENREQLSEVISTLEQCGTVSLEAVTQDFRREIIPSVGEWQQLFDAIPDRQLEILNLAVQSGYYEIPRGTTLDDLADEMGVTKTTASHQLRKAEKRVLEFFVTYLNLK
jgi:predicted DNA binding protein